MLLQSAIEDKHIVQEQISIGVSVGVQLGVAVLADEAAGARDRARRDHRPDVDGHAVDIDARLRVAIEREGHEDPHGRAKLNGRVQSGHALAARGEHAQRSMVHERVGHYHVVSIAIRVICRRSARKQTTGARCLLKIHPSG